MIEVGDDAVGNSTAAWLVFGLRAPKALLGAEAITARFFSQSPLLTTVRVASFPDSFTMRSDVLLVVVAVLRDREVAATDDDEEETEAEVTPSYFFKPSGFVSGYSSNNAPSKRASCRLY